MAKCKEVELRKTFESYDKDHSGFIDKSELRDAVKEALKEQKPKDEDVDEVTNVCIHPNLIVYLI